MRWILTLAALAFSLAGAAQAQPRNKVNFGLDWVAEAEYGGFYQAIATGIYAAHGLDVTIHQGGPQVNHMQLLIAGRLDFNLGGGRAIEFAAENLPFMAVAAIFQRDLAVLLAHPGQGNDSFESLRGKPILIGADTRNGWWLYLAAKYGYSDNQIRPYTFNMAPFLADKTSAQQGYISSEPFLIRKEAGFDPVVLPLSDSGYLGYGNIITTSVKLVREKPDLVRRFIDASIKGWYSYLYGDPTPANQLILKTNPEMPADLVDFGRR
ncbi:MAG: ABC transporter substrate-binding protein, partial [Alphaproteobacteria bacterium]|nr:ABC transporter substrate-binding protein [Alphaproteobacteria bacterium]